MRLLALCFLITLLTIPVITASLNNFLFFVLIELTENDCVTISVRIRLVNLLFWLGDAGCSYIDNKLLNTGIRQFIPNKLSRGHSKHEKNSMMSSM